MGLAPTAVPSGDGGAADGGTFGAGVLTYLRTISYKYYFKITIFFRRASRAVRFSPAAAVFLEVKARRRREKNVFLGSQTMVKSTRRREKKG